MMKTVDYYMQLPYHLEIIPDAVEGGYTAVYPDLPGCLTCAETPEEIVVSALDAKRAWLTAALEEGIEIAEPIDEDKLAEYSGQFKLRMPKSLHRALALHAKLEGVSMNQYCNYLLATNDALHTACKESK